MADLVVFIEHSDRDRVLLRPEIGEYAEGKFGLSFTIEKFSTFTMLNMSNWSEYQKAQEEGLPVEAIKAYISGYPDDTIRPNKSVTRAEMAAILARIWNQEGEQKDYAYTDVTATHWAKSAINQAAAMGLMQGYSDGSFKPEQSITRAEMTSIVARIITNVESDSGSFSDTNGHWAEGAIEKVKAADIIHGYGDGTFRLNQTLTRAEAVTMLNKWLGKAPLFGAEQKWVNVPEAHWAYGHIQAASMDPAK